MFDGLVSEYIVERDEEYRRKVVHPIAARRERYARELRTSERSATRARPPLATRLGDQLVRLGHRLGARPHTTTAPSDYLGG